MVQDVAQLGEQAARFRQLSGAMSLVARAVAITLPLYALFYAFEVAAHFDILFYRGSYNALFLALYLTMVFLLVPANRKSSRSKIPWYDVLLILAGWVGSSYVFFTYPATMVRTENIFASPVEQVLGLMTILVVVESVRRTLGWPLVILVGVFFLYANIAHLLPAPLGGPRYSLSRLIAYLYLYPEGIFGQVFEIAATIVILFITFGSFLHMAGGARFFIDFALSLAGHVRGGPAKVAILATALYGTMSGSPMADAAVTGSITIPLMKRVGYKAHFAAAIEAVASTGASLMPPVMGATAFMMAQLTGLGYPAVAVAAILPAILYYLCLFFQVDFEAAKTGLVGLPRKELPQTWKTLKGGLIYLPPLAVLIGLLMLLRRDPLTTVGYTLVVIVVMSWLRKDVRMGPAEILQALESGGKGIIMVGGIMSLIGIVAASLTVTGLGVRMATILTTLAGGNLLVLVLLAGAACYVMGMGVSVVLSYILLALLVAPALVQLGVPILAAHFFIMFMGLSTFITPPHAGAVYVTSGIAGSTLFRTGFQAMRLGIVAYLLPMLIVFRPALLLIGDPLEVASAAVSAAVGAYFIAGAVEGYMLREASLWQRVMLAIGGLGLFVPDWQVSLAGAAILVAPVAVQVRAARALPRPALRARSAEESASD